MTVANITGNGKVTATFGETGLSYFLHASEYELITEPTEKIIKFEDIREGDRLQVTLDDLVLTGVASELSAGWWYTPKGRLLVAFRSVAVITLLDRPKPELPTEPGSVIIATEVRGVKGRWELYRYIDDVWLSARTIERRDSHYSKHITEWEPAHIVPGVAE